MSLLTRMFPLLAEWVNGDKKQLKDTIKSWQKYSRPVVLSSTDHVDQRSLLFQCAVSYAKEGNHVAFICQTPVSQLPLPIHGMPKPNPATLATVKFIYLKTMRDVHHYCASIHELTTCPDVIIVDAIDVYIAERQILTVRDFKKATPVMNVLQKQRYAIEFLTESSLRMVDKQTSEEHELARFCAILSDAMNFCQQKTKLSQKNDEEKCQLIISSKETKAFTNVYQKMGFDIITLKAKEMESNCFGFSMDLEDQSVHLNYTVDQTKGIFLNEVQCITKF